MRLAWMLTKGVIGFLIVTIVMICEVRKAEFRLRCKTPWNLNLEPWPKSSKRLAIRTARETAIRFLSAFVLMVYTGGHWLDGARNCPIFPAVARLFLLVFRRQSKDKDLDSCPPADARNQGLSTIKTRDKDGA
jgi:hypothetical protein